MGNSDYIRLRPLPVDVRQATPYTCGVSCVQAILNYYGFDRGESELAKQLRATKDAGTSAAQIVHVFQKYGLKAVVRKNTSLKNLKTNLKHNIPTMVAIQAWPNNPVKNWQNDWEDGHWVVVIAMNDRNIVFEDPSLLGVRGLLSQEEFLSRWHDYEGPPPYQKGQDKPLMHLSIAVMNKPVRAEVDAAVQDELASTLTLWVDADTPEQLKKAAAALGRVVEARRDELPPELFKTPSNTLYRAILVARSMYNKVRGGEPLVLKDREYSSWTYDVNAAKKFGNGPVVSKKFKPDYVLFILKRTFTDDEVFLNVVEAAKYANVGRSYLELEKEIIVRNRGQNYTFRPEEVHLMRVDRRDPDYFFFKPKKA